MFERDLQQQIIKANQEFIKGAKERAKEAKEVPKDIFLTETEEVLVLADISDLDEIALQRFMEKCSLIKDNDKKENILRQLGFLRDYKGKLKPTGLAILLFGKSPQLSYPNALIRAIIKMDGKEDIKTIEGPLIEQPDKIEDWYKKYIGKHIDRSDAHRKDIYDYPLEVIREAIINAIVHRDYDIIGAAIYVEISEDAMIIKSPGKPVEPLTIDQIKSFSAPSLSRNPKIMYIFDQLGLVEQRGLRFSTIKRLPTEFDLPLPIVTFENPYIVFTFPMKYSSIKKVLEKEKISELKEKELRAYNWMQIKIVLREGSTKKNFLWIRKPLKDILGKWLNLALSQEKVLVQGHIMRLICKIIEMMSQQKLSEEEFYWIRTYNATTCRDKAENSFPYFVSRHVSRQCVAIVRMKL